MTPIPCRKVNCSIVHRRYAERACSGHTCDILHAAGLRTLRLRLQETNADSVRADFVLLKHGHEAVDTIWDAHSLV